MLRGLPSPAAVAWVATVVASTGITGEGDPTGAGAHPGMVRPGTLPGTLRLSLDPVELSPELGASEYVHLIANGSAGPTSWCCSVPTEKARPPIPSASSLRLALLQTSPF